MSYQTLKFEITENVAWITLNRPESFNAMNMECMRELLDVANRCGSDRTVRAAVLTGAGNKAFCAGGDVASFAKDPATVDLLIKEMTACLHVAISRFAWMNAPLIGAINGVAAGAGLSMSACCDLAIASDTAKFTSAYTQIGLSPDGSSTYYLTRLIGTRRAMELCLTNRVLSAQEALDWGLVNQVVAADQLMNEAAKLAHKLAKGPTLAHGAVKKLLQVSSTSTLESQMERETRSIVELCQSPDGLEGVKAFIEKRKPNFTGQR